MPRKADDSITPAKLKAAGWTHDKADKSCWWMDFDIGGPRSLFYYTDGRKVEYLFLHTVDLRTVTGWRDLCALVAALKGESK